MSKAFLNELIICSRKYYVGAHLLNSFTLHSTRVSLIINCSLVKLHEIQTERGEGNCQPCWLNVSELYELPRVSSKY